MKEKDELISYVHTVWIGPAVMDKYHEYNLISIKNIYGIKPTLWVYNYIPTNIINDLADVKEIPDVIINNIKNVRCTGGYSDYASDEIKAILTMTDYIRYYVLYLYGGIYFDMDGISYKSITNIPNSDTYDIILGKYWDGTCNGAVMYVKESFNPHMNALMTEFINMISGQSRVQWSSTGPGLITRYINTNHNKMNVLVMPRQAFYIYEWVEDETRKIFEEGGCKSSDLEQIYYLHLWSSANGKLLATIDDNYVTTHNSLYTIIAKDHLTWKI